jgi:photosystem II stability/assembly factor-like uncharacterized protein
LDANKTYFRSGAWSSVQNCVVVGGSTTKSVVGLILYSKNNGAFGTWRVGKNNPAVLYQDVASYSVSSISYFIAVDNIGNVTISYDNGVTWPFVKRVSRLKLNTIVINKRNGVAWCVGLQSIIYRSSNSSRYTKWANMTLISNKVVDLYGITVMNKTNFIVSGQNAFIAVCRDYVMRIFCTQISSAYIATNINNLLFGLSSANSMIAMLSGNNGDILKTIDGGQSWLKLPNIQSTSTSVNNWISAGGLGPYSKIVHMISLFTVFIVDTIGNVKVSNDGGDTWIDDSSLARSSKLQLFINMYSSNLGIVGGSFGNIYIKNPRPSPYPTSLPSSKPFSDPSFIPSTQPFFRPSVQPTKQPSRRPVQPSSVPSTQPSRLPTNQPSHQPVSNPTIFPTTQPSIQPSMCPSAQPFLSPSPKPTIIPSSAPSIIPSLQPSSQPNQKPSRQPSSQPSHWPSTQPFG